MAVGLMWDCCRIAVGLLQDCCGTHNGLYINSMSVWEVIQVPPTARGDTSAAYCMDASTPTRSNSSWSKLPIPRMRGPSAAGAIRELQDPTSCDDALLLSPSYPCLLQRILTKLWARYSAWCTRPTRAGTLRNTARATATSTCRWHPRPHTC